MSIFSDLWDNIKHFFSADVEPALKTFLEQFATGEGTIILNAAIAAAPELITGNFAAVSAEVLATVVAQSKTLAAQDAKITLQQVQSALQVAKVAQSIQTPADAKIIEASAPQA
jgi:hypothetical protein